MKHKFTNPLPALSDVLFLVIFFIGIFNATSFLGDGDTGYHIRAGEYILSHHSIPTQDIFSFHKPVFTWVAHEWLSEVLMALVHQAGGLTAVVLFFIVLIGIIYRWLFLSLAKEFNILIALIITLLAVQSSMLHWLARPHIFSLALIFWWYYALNLFQYKHKNYLYVLPLVMLVWVNLHGGYITGFLLLGIYGAGNLISILQTEGPEKAAFVKKFKQLFLISLLCVLASVVNPRTYEILFFPFKFLSHKYLMDHNRELLSPNFHYFMPFTVYLFLTIVVIAFCKPKLNPIEILLILAFTYLSLTSIRHIPLFAIIVAPIVARRMNDFWKKSNFGRKKSIDAFTERLYFMDKAAVPLLWSFILAALTFGILYFKDIRFTFSPKHKPVDAFNFVVKEHLSGHMFCDDEFGDYIIYAGWPEYKVFVDGRNDMYGNRMIKQYFQITMLKKPWKALLKKYDVNWVIFPTNAAFSATLAERKEWKLIYSDKVASVFVRNTPENEFLTHKYSAVKLASAL